jgi:hypothetical protein
MAGGARELGEHDEYCGGFGRVVVVEERVSRVGVLLDVVVDAEVGQQSFQPLGGAAVAAAVLGAVAADDRARPAQVIRLFTIEGVGRV